MSSPAAKLATTLRVWRSFSANNSGSFYLVATFGDPRTAIAVRDELRAYIEAHEAEYQAMSQREQRLNNGLTMANLEFSERVGFEVPVQLASGYADDIFLELGVAGSQLVISHDDCLGFEQGLIDYLKLHEGDVHVGGFDRDPVVSLRIYQPASMSGPVRNTLELMFSMRGFLPVENVVPSNGARASFRCSSVEGLVAEFEAVKIPELVQLLEADGVEDFDVTIDKHGDLELFTALAEARCPECASSDLDLLTSGRFDTPVDQLACSACQGMFALGEWLVGLRNGV